MDYLPEESYYRLPRGILEVHEIVDEEPLCECRTPFTIEGRRSHSTILANPISRECYAHMDCNFCEREVLCHFLRRIFINYSRNNLPKSCLHQCYFICIQCYPQLVNHVMENSPPDVKQPEE